MAEQRPVTVFGQYPLHIGDQPFHNLGMQRRIPCGMPLIVQPGSRLSSPINRNHCPGMTFSASPLRMKLKSRVLQSAISATRHPVYACTSSGRKMSSVSACARVKIRVEGSKPTPAKDGETEIGEGP